MLASASRPPQALGLVLGSKRGDRQSEGAPVLGRCTEPAVGGRTPPQLKRGRRAAYLAAILDPDSHRVVDGWMQESMFAARGGRAGDGGLAVGKTGSTAALLGVWHI